jgi:polyisoprenyl-phosphate glycosyltransferase
MMEKPAKPGSITAVVVVDLDAPDETALRALGDELARLAEDSEIVIVANGVSAEVAKNLANLIDRIEDTTVHFLAEHVDRDVATLVGMDRALGDWVVVLTPTMREVTALRMLLAEGATHEIVFGTVPRAEQPTGFYAGAGKLFFLVYRWLTGAAIEWPTPRIRIYSRAAARYLLTRLDGEFLMKSASFRGTFPGIVLPVAGVSPPGKRLSTPEALGKAARSILGASTVPLRLTVFFAVAGAVLALAAVVYVVMIYLTRADVQPGWTTLSLLIAGMLFIFSVMFALLTGYILAMYSSIQPRSRVPVVRELRSRHRRQSNRLNVLGEDGALKLGAPSPRVPEVRP